MGHHGTARLNQALFKGITTFKFQLTVDPLNGIYITYCTLEKEHSTPTKYTVVSLAE